MNNLPFNIGEICDVFDLKGDFESYFTSDNGHINNTYVLKFMEGEHEISYLLQEINTFAFKNPDELMENIVGVTKYLRNIIENNGGDPERETMSVFLTTDGKPYFRDDKSRCWRLYNFITDSYTCETVDCKHFYSAGKAFGIFQNLLADYPIETLHDTIPRFHNTASRFLDFKDAVARDVKGRAQSVRDEIDFVLEREADASVLVNMIEAGELPLRVTHNDTKLNNILFDNKTGEGVCVVDLDTVMPGLSLYDFGDSIRFGANTAAEDERDLSKVSLDLGLYESFTDGFLTSAAKTLTPTEVKYLPFSAKMMTYECGMRFLTDYLNGDVYFKIHCEDHNLVRCRTQFTLVADMERKMDEMSKITDGIYARHMK